MKYGYSVATSYQLTNQRLSDEAISADDKNAHNESTPKKSLARQGCSKFA